MSLQEIGARAVLENLNSFLAGTGKMDAALDGVSAAATRSGSQMASGFKMGISALGALGAAAAAAAGVAGIGSVITSAAGFEKTMAGVKAVSGSTADEMKQLSELALRLGKDTSFSASEAGKAIEELVKAGVSVPDIMNGAAAAAVNLAAAGGVDLASAAEIAANAMSMFGIAGNDMAKVANQIAGAANASSLDVGDFKFSLAAVGAVAATVGQSFESTAQAIAVMGAAGIKGSDAGTSLKTMLMNLQPQTKKQISLFEELGITTADGSNKFFTATGAAKSMADIAQVLQDALKGMTDQQRLAALETMFGSDAIRAGAVLAKAGAAGFNEMAAAMGKVTAESVAKDRLDNFSGSMEQLSGSVETAMIVLGTAFLPMLKRMADGLGGAVDAAVPFIERVGPQIGAALDAAGKAAGVAWKALEPGRELLGSLASLVQTFVIPAFKAFTGGKFDEGFASLGSAANIASVLIQDALGKVGPWLQEQGGIILSRLGEWGQSFVSWIGPKIPEMLDALQDLRERMFAWVVEQVPGWIDQLGKWAVELVAWVAPMINPALQALGGYVSRVLDWVAAQAPPLLQKFLSEWLPAAIGWVARAAVELVKELPSILTTIATWSLQTIPKLVTLAADLGKALVSGILGGLGNLAGQLGTLLFNEVMSAIGKARQWLGLDSSGGGGTQLKTQGRLSAAQGPTGFFDRDSAIIAAQFQRDADKLSGITSSQFNDILASEGANQRAAADIARDRAEADLRAGALAAMQAAMAGSLSNDVAVRQSFQGATVARSAGAAFAEALTAGMSAEGIGAALRSVTSAAVKAGIGDGDTFKNILSGLAQQAIIEKLGLGYFQDLIGRGFRGNDVLSYLGSFGAEQLPEFARGGVVPGPIGTPQRILAHGGELVVPNNGSLVGRMVLPSWAGMMGGNTNTTNYNLTANYTRPEEPQSIRYELQTLRMLAGR